MTNPKIALQVLKGVTKGDGLESRLAMPAWAPILSLESVDGEVWRTMRQDFDRLHKIVAPRTADLAPIAQRHVDVALARGAVIDANAITRLAIGIFIEFLFGRCDVDAEIDVLARASWEWRKEIACKGKGRADAKWAAVETTISLLRADAELWNVFGEEWMDPRRCVCVHIFFCFGATLLNLVLLCCSHIHLVLLLVALVTTFTHALNIISQVLANYAALFDIACHQHVRHHGCVQPRG